MARSVFAAYFGGVELVIRVWDAVDGLENRREKREAVSYVNSVCVVKWCLMEETGVLIEGCG